MHGRDLGSAVLANAVVDSMGGVVDCGGGIGVKTSPHRAAIEKAQAELRQEYDVREERRRELEFLEKGGNPLDFKLGNAASHSVQSTSLTDQAEHFVNCEAKGSFALTASPHGDSVESSGRPRVPTVCEPNTADNLLLFDGEDESLEAERNSRHLHKRNRAAHSERSSQVNTNQNAKETEDSAIFRPYARRNRSRINRDPVRGGSRDGKGSISETTNQKDKHIPSISYPSSTTSNGNMISKTVTSNNQLKIELDGVPTARETIATAKTSPSKDDLGVIDRKKFVDVLCGEPDPAGEKKNTVSANTEILSPEAVPKVGQETSSRQQNEVEDYKGDEIGLTNNSRNSNAAIGVKGLDSESSCTRNNLGIDVNNEKDLLNLEKVDSNGISMQKTAIVEGMVNPNAGEMVSEKNEGTICGSIPIINDNRTSVCETNTKVVKDENQTHRNSTELVDEVKCSSDMGKVQQTDSTALETDGKVGVLVNNSSTYKGDLCTGKPQSMVDISAHEVTKNTLSGTDVTASTALPGSDSGSVLADTAKEDSILEEARTIQAKRKRIAELSFGTVPLEIRQKSNWDFVLEEMAWLANDFAQERLWKMTAAAQICRRVAFTSRSRFEERVLCGKVKKVAFALADAVMQFWRSAAELHLEGGDKSISLKDGEHDLVDGDGATENKEISKELKCKKPKESTMLGIQEYVQRFLKYNSSSFPCLQASEPQTPDTVSEPGITETSWDDHLTEESLFYSIPSGAMEAYRISIESHLMQCEKNGSSLHEEVETSTYDAVAEVRYGDIGYDEDEGETSAYYLPGAFEASKSSKSNHKNQKTLMKLHSARSYELGADVAYGNYTLMGKRPANNANVGSVPTKRMRTASRQRIVSPFGPGTAGTLPVPAKTDASSGDTSSFQDEQSSLHGGSVVQKSMEVESGVNFEKQLPYDFAETSAKPKKKKKAHLGSAYDRAWHLDSTFHNEQRDHWKKRSESHHVDSNGLYGQPTTKKQKTMKQSLDNTFDKTTPVTGSIPSPAASQMSNMSNPNKFIKLIGGRDRGRKTKGLKISAGQQGSGNPWSLFEDQALVVLVHDMGPNWELISDAMNSTLKIKCIYRNPNECKERHKILMDRGAGEGADSAEDSGTSQSYPSTLPGIPKGSARQLFQRLQGPMEEDTLKSHFEKIIMIGKKLHNRRTQNDVRDPKQIVPVHNAQVMALSQVFPNNLNGGVLTPLDLCDAITSSQDVFTLENPGSHPELTILNKGASASVLPSSGANPSLQGSSGTVLGSNLSTSGPPNASVRDGRFNVPRASLPLDEQHRMQQYNQMLSNRNIQQSSSPSPGAISGRTVPGGNNMGIGGVNRGMPLSRSGFQGMASSSAMPNSGNMLSSGMVGMPNPTGMISGISPGQGNSMLRPREAMHMMRMQAAQGNTQGIPAFNGLSSGFTNQTTPPVQTYPGHLQQQHQISSQQSHVLSNPHQTHLQSPGHASGAQQGYAIRPRHVHQQYIQQQQHQQQQQQFTAASGALMPAHVQPQPPVPPISSSPQNSSQIQSLISSQSLSMPPITASSTMTSMSLQNQQKPQLPPHGPGRNPQSSATGPTSQVGKQKQRQLHQQFQQSGRQHPQQRQPIQAQQHNKLVKGMGRGNMMHQNLSVDLSQLNGLSVATGIQTAEKGDQVMPVMKQGQGSSLSGTSMSHLQQSKPLVPPQSSNYSQSQQKVFAGASTPPSKQLQHIPSQSDHCIKGQDSPVSPGNTLPTTHQSVSPAVAPPDHQPFQPHIQPHQKQGSQMQPAAAQRILPQNHQGNSEFSSKSQIDRTPGDLRSINSTSQTTTTSTSTTVPQPGSDCANMRPIISHAVTPSQKASEHMNDSAVQNTSKAVRSSVTNTSGKDQVPSFSQRLGQQQLPSSLPSHGHTVGAQRQLQSPSPPQKQSQLPEQQSVQNQRHFPSEQKQRQQVPQVQAAQGNACTEPPDAKVE